MGVKKLFKLIFSNKGAIKNSDNKSFVSYIDTCDNQYFIFYINEKLSQMITFDEAINILNDNTSVYLTSEARIALESTVTA